MLTLPKMGLSAPREIVIPTDDAIQPKPVREKFEDDAAHQAAVDAWDAAMKEYAATYKADKLPLVPGRKPTVFIVRSLDERQKRHVENLRRKDGDLQFETIAYGCHDIMNLTDASGAPVMIEREKSDVGLRLPAHILTLFIDDDVRFSVYWSIVGASTLDARVAKSH